MLFFDWFSVCRFPETLLCLLSWFYNQRHKTSTQASTLKNAARGLVLWDVLS